MATMSESKKQEIIEGYKKLLSEREAIAGMILERETEAEEHALVLRTLKKSAEDKKAWRLVGDVLVEQTVKEVLPEVEKNHANLKGVVENGRQQLERKNEELKGYEKKFNITIKDRNDGSGAGDGGHNKKDEDGNAKQQQQQQQGVLVS